MGGPGSGRKKRPRSAPLSVTPTSVQKRRGRPSLPAHLRACTRSRTKRQQKLRQEKITRDDVNPFWERDTTAGRISSDAKAILLNIVRILNEEKTSHQRTFREKPHRRAARLVGVSERGVRAIVVEARKRDGPVAVPRTPSSWQKGQELSTAS